MRWCARWWRCCSWPAPSCCGGRAARAPRTRRPPPRHGRTPRSCGPRRSPSVCCSPPSGATSRSWPPPAWPPGTPSRCQCSWAPGRRCSSSPGWPPSWAASSPTGCRWCCCTGSPRCCSWCSPSSPPSRPSARWPADPHGGQGLKSPRRRADSCCEAGSLLRQNGEVMNAIKLDECQDVLVQTAGVIAAQRQFAQRLRQRTVPDPLTGLPVRSLLIDRLELALAASGPDTGRLAVLCCTLDGLTALGYRHGSEVADVARAEAAGRLVGAVRQGDVVARMGGQTFVLLCPGIHQVTDAEGIARRVATAFDEPLHPLPDLPHRVRLIAGVALSGRASTPESLIAAANEAMTSLRRAG